jgi:hypothetical protein
MKKNIACQSRNITRMLNQNLSIWLHGQLKFRCILNNFGLSKPCIGNIRRYCIVRESNPGRLRGRRAFYHQTNDAFLQLTNSYQKNFLTKYFIALKQKPGSEQGASLIIRRVWNKNGLFDCIPCGGSQFRYQESAATSRNNGVKYFWRSNLVFKAKLYTKSFVTFENKYVLNVLD